MSYEVVAPQPSAIVAYVYLLFNFPKFYPGQMQLPHQQNVVHLLKNFDAAFSKGITLTLPLPVPVPVPVAVTVAVAVAVGGCGRGGCGLCGWLWVAVAARMVILFPII